MARNRRVKTSQPPTTPAAVVADATRELGREFREASEGAGTHLGKAVLTLARGAQDVTDLGAAAIRRICAFAGYSPQALCWVLEKIRPGLAKKLREVPEKYRREPPLEIAGPVLDGLRYKVQDDDIRELFENLLVSAMDERTLATTHPRFVEIVRQMSSVDARIFKVLVTERQTGIMDISRVNNSKGFGMVAENLSTIGILHQSGGFKLSQICIDNLCALGLADTDWTMSMIDEAKYYKPIIDHPSTKKIVERIRKSGQKEEFRKGVLALSPLGEAFASCCVRPAPISGDVNVAPD